MPTASGTAAPVRATRALFYADADRDDLHGRRRRAFASRRADRHGARLDLRARQGLADRSCRSAASASSATAPTSRATVFMFLSTNPTIATPPLPSGENWWMQLNALTGGDNGASASTSMRRQLHRGRPGHGRRQVEPGRAEHGGRRALAADRAGRGRRSRSSRPTTTRTAEYCRPRATRCLRRPLRLRHLLLQRGGLTSFTYGARVTGNSPFCLEDDQRRQRRRTGFRRPTARSERLPADYDYMTRFTTGSRLRRRRRPACRQSTAAGTRRAHRRQDYANKKHVHEYDDMYDVTGVNMLAASDAAFNLPNAYPQPLRQHAVQGPGDEPVPESGGAARQSSTAAGST